MPARYITYDAFGNTAAETDVAISHMFGYTGREFDKGTGLQYNRERYYAPKSGRFISQDPLSFEAGDANLYRMTGNHPNMATDPSGLFEGGTQSSAEVQNEILQWMEVGRGAVSESDRRRVAAKLAQLQDIKSTLEEQERITMRMAGKAVFDHSTGLGEWKEFDKKTGYLPFVHEGVDYMDGTAQNAVNIVSGGASNYIGITATTEHVGWAWEGQRWAFGTSMVALELADGAIALRSFRVPRNGIGILERGLGGTTGHSYAGEIVEGGSGMAFAVHGQFRMYSNNSYMFVPEGTSITLPRHGIGILDETGQHIERGDWDGLFALAKTNERIADDLEGMATFLPWGKNSGLRFDGPRESASSNLQEVNYSGGRYSSVKTLRAKHETCRLGGVYQMCEQIVCNTKI